MLINNVEHNFLKLDPSLENELPIGLINRPVVNLNVPEIKNPFIALAVPLFVLADTIKNQKIIPEDVGEFRKKLVQHINSFANAIKKQDIPMSTFITARYFLCCFLDEIILSTEWAKNSRWGFDSLLSKFHNDTNGGERFFVILHELTHNSGKNGHLLELAFLCLKFGFCGKYKFLSRGKEHLAMIEEDLYKVIIQNLNTLDTPSSKTPRSQKGRKSYMSYALCVVVALSIIFCVALWRFMYYDIKNTTDVALVKLASLIGTNPVRQGFDEGNHA